MEGVSARPTPYGLALAGIVLVGAALRFSDLGDQSFWGDEAITDRVLGQGGLWDLPGLVRESEAAPPPYYMILWAWARAIGSDEAGLRSLSAVLGTATIPIMYLAVRELSSRRAALVAAALCACSPFLVWYSQEARVYALYVLLVATSFWLFARALHDSRRRVLVAWGLVSAAGVASFYLAAIPVAIEAAVLLWVARDRRLTVVAATLIVLATAGAMLTYALDHRIKQVWIQPISLEPRITQTFELFLVGNSDPAAIAFIVAGAAAVGAGVALALFGEAKERRAFGIALLVGLLGLAAAVAGRLLDADYVIARNVLFAWVPLAAAFAIALGSPRLRAAGPVAAGLVCAIGIWLVLEVKRDDRLQRVDFRQASELLGDPLADGYRTIVAPSSFQPTAMRSYLPGISEPSYFPPPSVEVAVLQYDRPDRGHLCWWGGACSMPATGPLMSAPPGYVFAGRSSAGRFTLTRFRSSRPRHPELDLRSDTYVALQGG